MAKHVVLRMILGLAFLLLLFKTMDVYLELQMAIPDLPPDKLGEAIRLTNFLIGLILFCIIGIILIVYDGLWE